MSTYWDWPGSRWWRVDFHTHSPASHDFGSQSERDAQDWECWIKAVRDAEIQAVAITDHNSAEGISKLQQAAASVEDAPVLFPGVEITASDGVHLLLLMDPDCKQQHIDALLSKVEIPVDERGAETARSTLSIEEILGECRGDTLIIGAHVNTDAGLLQEHDGQQRIAVLRHQNLAAVEVHPNREIDESWLDGSRSEIKRRLPQVWASDGHDFNELGRRFTWVKMTRPNLEGLRLALLDGAPSSLKTKLDDPNVHADLAIESITVDKGKFMGRSEPITVEFNPWLNAIIGGRGTGKSTLIDFCRKTLRREAELDRSDRSEEGSLRSLFDRRMRVSPSRREEGLLTDGTRVEVVYRKNSECFLLSWDQKGSVRPIARLDGDEQIPEEGDIRERFPVRIYSQKQLFALAQDPNALLAVIDDSEIVGGTGLKRQLEQKKTRYLSLCAEARAAYKQADGLPTLRASHAEVRRKLDILEGGGQAQALNEYRKRRQQNETWRAILEAASQAVEAVGDSAAELSVADLNIGVDAEDDPAQASLMRMHETLRRVVAHLESRVRESVEQTRREIDEIDKGADADQWRTAVEASENEFQRVSSQLAKEGISAPNEYGDLLEQAAKLEREIASLEKEQKRAEELESEAAKTLAEYRKLRCELSNKRQSFVREMSGESIRVEIDEYANRKNLAEELSEILGIEHFADDRRELARRIQPKQGQSWGWERLDGVIAAMRQFLSGDRGYLTMKDARFGTALKRVPPERIDRLALYLPEDAVAVRFKDRGDWRPLPQGSPGQQTAALLAFVLGYGFEPIILDQPEDDLDNSLIYELLVRRLRETKTKRQVIVVTHNPNIVVHGDAELVLSLEARGGQSRIACQGGLQERLVREEICRVMEGGREAFKRRYQRIMPSQ